MRGKARQGCAVLVLITLNKIIKGLNDPVRVCVYVCACVCVRVYFLYVGVLACHHARPCPYTVEIG